ncbi:hypothetical protein ARTHRO9AX_220319 [Arthrobacter sp. 9AX]|nr:hypothetical protein ARTHRO9AX_220319 [Arthrobacter sp. 9AX]
MRENIRLLPFDETYSEGCPKGVFFARDLSGRRLSCVGYFSRFVPARVCLF